MVRVTGECETPEDDCGSALLVITKGGGRTLLVTQKEDIAVEALSEPVTVYSHTSMTDVVTGGMVRVVVSTMLVQPVAADQATSREVTYGGKLIVVSIGRTSGGRMKMHGGSQLIIGFGSVQMLGSI